MALEVAIINRSKLVRDSDVASAVAAVQRQVREHFAPAWSIDANLSVLSSAVPPANRWTITLVDHSEQKDTLGFHEDDGGLPSGIVGVASALEDRVPWSAVLSHEVLELLADPDTTQTRATDADGAGDGSERWALEVCDPVEASGLGQYRIDGIDLENFVLPNYWTAGSPGTWDYLGVLKGPLTLSPSGYAQVLTPAGWSQRNAEHVRASKLVPAAISRRSRRQLRHMAKTRAK